MTIINRNSDLGGMEYPFLTQFDDWFIQSSPLDAAGDGRSCTLRWVKDNKVNDLTIPNLSTINFLEATGLRLNIGHKGPFVLSKRISRLMRPYRFWEFRQPEQVTIQQNLSLNGRSWDGCALISRRYLNAFSKRYAANHPHLPKYELAAHLAELKNCQRWEITLMHEGGQEKGHALVVDDLKFVDFMLPAGSTKTEVTLTDNVFIGLHPVHGRSDMRLDIQSLINLYPFFEPAKLLAWLSQEADLFLNRIQSGQLDVILSRIENIQSEDQLHELRRWYMGEYIASGGKLMWFPAAVKAMGRQFLRRLNHGNDNFRFPIPGARHYIFPASVGARSVPRGHIQIEEAAATAWVNQEDWDEHIVDILGGCDGDDALWLFGFTDFDNSRKILAWRSPNQLGEYVLLTPTADSDTIAWDIVGGQVTWPRMDSRKLTARIDQVNYEYGELQPFPQNHAANYAIEAMQPAINNALQNGGMLGAYCNALMVLTAVRGSLPFDLPARLEDVIDGSVKAPVDLSPIRTWIDLMMQDIVADSYDAVPPELVNRILPALGEDDANILRVDQSHWLTALMTMAKHQVEIYQVNLNVLAAQTEVPLDIFSHGLAWEEQGQPLAAAYQRVLRQDGLEDANLNLLAQLEGQHSGALLGAAAYIYNRGLSDTLLWLPDPKLPDGQAGPQQPGTARLFLYALRQIGLVGEPVWTTEGAVSFYDEKPTGIPAQLNGFWFNMLKLRNADWSDCSSMSQVPWAIRATAKAQIAHDINQFTGMTVNTRITNNNRMTVHDNNGNLLAFVKPGQETRLLRAGTWHIAFADSKDGDLHTVLTPVG